jgi:hypothetical protein
MSIALMRRHILLCIYLKRDIGTRQFHLNWLFQIHLDKRKKHECKEEKNQKETTMKCK